MEFVEVALIDIYRVERYANNLIIELCRWPRTDVTQEFIDEGNRRIEIAYKNRGIISINLTKIEASIIYVESLRCKGGVSINSLCEADKYLRHYEALERAKEHVISQLKEYRNYVFEKIKPLNRFCPF